MPTAPVAEVVITGPVAGNTVFLLHGWPDLPEELYRLQVPALIENGFRVALITLPLYRPGSKLNQDAPWLGFDMVQVADSVKAAVDRTMAGRGTVEKEAPVLIAHDWGSIIGWHLVKAHPGLFSKFVSLDVGLGIDPGIKTIVFMVTYQMFLIIALFLIPRFLFGDRLTRFAARVLRAPSYQTSHATMNYLYFQTWLAKIARPSKLLKSMTSSSVPSDVSILFLFGEKMKIQFHNAKFRERVVAAKPGNKVQGFPSDHWFFSRSKHAAAVNKEILEFLQAPSKL